MFQISSNAEEEHKNKKISFLLPKRKSVPASDSPPFYTVFKSDIMNKAKDLPVLYCQPSCLSNNCSSENVPCSCNQLIPYRALSYGQVFYEQSKRNLEKALNEHRSALGKCAELAHERHRDCHYDLSEPFIIGSSKHASKILEKAIKGLNEIHEDVEWMSQYNERFEKNVMSRAARILNHPRDKNICKTLLPIRYSPPLRTKTEEICIVPDRTHYHYHYCLGCCRQHRCFKDPEPKLELYQLNPYTRIRPLYARLPPKPSIGFSVHVNHDFDTIHNMKFLEDEAGRLSPKRISYKHCQCIKQMI